LFWSSRFSSSIPQTNLGYLAGTPWPCYPRGWKLFNIFTNTIMSNEQELEGI
jgi:hypothetical protein